MTHFLANFIQPFSSIYYDPNIKFLQGTQIFILGNARFWEILGDKGGKNEQHLNFVKSDHFTYHFEGNAMPINVSKGHFL